MFILKKYALPNVAHFRKISRTARLSSDELVVHRDSADNNETTPFEFTEANMTRLNAIIKNYPEGSKRSAMGAALDLVQRQMGWVPISAMHKVSEILGVPRMRVYEYSTFYTMVKRSFKGKYHVKVCTTTPCMIMGSDIILQAAEQACGCKAGHVSPDGLFGVDEVQCAGACANAPVLVVEDDYYEDVTVCDVEEIICTIRNGGIPQAGPRSGRFAAEPSCGLTSLCNEPPKPGHGVQPALLKK
ncbi:NADH dehydrogenase [ubiquinone] flavoprotein 2, mitochondrial-like [Cydia pomonella]|uniref:NADH dehydrogenase [ubiquinone] flavoprotein 2, mitochondrial-like n=1 Tax=Cydia pomonella TaxID=82600 RepID=UPI002ADD7D12|nr:NADH dehydrogenase [ubiquinone] flavoprotein 2, mitochondrial-like [Cydia pomonella]